MNAIEVTDLTKTFDGKRVLNGISFSVKTGEVFGFLGPNGAGKTTTMRILLGLLKPSGGSGLVLGSILSGRQDLRRRVGVLLENNGIYDRLSAYENLDYYARLYRVPERTQRITRMLEFAGLKDRMHDPVGTFSLGMKRKLGLARAIIHDPEILFLDEPSSGLDPEAQRMVRDLIRGLSEQESMTVFLNSHNLDEVQRVCSTVAILHQGKIKAFDTVSNLQAASSRLQYEITLADHTQSSQALAVLESLHQVQEAWADGGRIIAAITSGSAASPLLTRLIEQGIAVEEGRKVTRSLEEIYLDAVRQAEGAA
jgi:ABC-2 type transport system ATP-binding protein